MASEAELSWLKQYVDTGEARQAIRDWFPDCGKDAKNPDAQIRIRAAQLKQKLSVELENAVREKLSGDSIVMLGIIRDLAVSSTQDAVKLKAADSWMDRAGYRPVNETKDLTPQHTGKELRQAAIEELTSCGVSLENAELIADGKKVKSAEQADTGNPQ